MTAVYPLHPDDRQMLQRIRYYLAGYRVCHGLSQDEASMRVNDTKGSVFALEAFDFWQGRFSRLQYWARAFDLKLEAELIFNYPRDMRKRLQSDPEVATYRALVATSDEWPKWQRMELTTSLVLIRKARKVSTRELSMRLGVTRNALQNWEAGADDFLLGKVLHHARVLGGRLELKLEGI